MNDDPRPRIELVGDWTSANILIRLLQVIDSPWGLSRAGLTHRDTGETCQVQMRPRDELLSEALATGECPLRPSLDAETLAGISTHRAVLRVDPTDDLTGWDAARAVLRCGAGLVDVGALAVRCVHSGLAHSGDHLQTLDRMASQAEDHGNMSLLGEALYQALVMPLRATSSGMRTLGMALLEAPDAVIVGADVPQSMALDAMEDLCLRTLSGQGPSAGDVVRSAPNRPAFRVERGPDPTDPVEHDHNPYGLWRMTLEEP